MLSRAVVWLALAVAAAAAAVSLSGSGRAAGAAGGAAAAGGARRADQDFEFDDAGGGGAALRGEGGARYGYDPHSPLCGGVACARGQQCVLRAGAGRAALCVDTRAPRDRGDGVPAPGADEAADRDDDDDIFYDAPAPAPAPPEPRPPPALRQDRCVGCGGGSAGGGSGGFLCGSDNRTYSSLCRLDLHNCVRRPRRPVAARCRGFCPCAAPAPAPPARRPAPRPLDDLEDDEWGRTAEARNEVSARAGPQRRPGRDRLERRRPAGGGGGGGCEPDEMADRLLDWFSVLRGAVGAEGGAAAPPRASFPRACKAEVRWMFAHLDADGDGRLSRGELYALRHDERERCLRPFLAACGAGAGAGAGAGGGGAGAAGVTRAAWCGCLRRAARPCTALARAHPHTRSSGAYVPACDARGYYRARQCHPALGVCWCVSPHGAEVSGSRTRGAPACPAPHPPSPPTHPTPAAAAAYGGERGAGRAPADDEDAEAETELEAETGSGDGAPGF